MTSFVANLSTLFGHLPLNERAEAAAKAGFERVESWWDFDSPNPPASELDSFIESLSRANLELVAINSYGGHGTSGLASLPNRIDEFRQSVQAVARVAKVTQARMFNIAFGKLYSRQWERSAQFETARDNYAWAAQEVSPFGGVVLIEALSGAANSGHPFKTGYDVVEFIDGFLPEVENVGLLFDTYHLATNGVDPVACFRDVHETVKHIQLADYPGRGAPGTGTIDFEAMTAEISASRYSGSIALEYFPQESRQT